MVRRLHRTCETPGARKVFDLHHGLSHAGPRPTQKSILKSFVWKKLKTDVVNWCRECHDCMTSKVTTHVRAPLTKRPPPDRRFGSIHVDLVGPLPESEGYRYLFTIVDRYSRWPEAIPVQDMTAETCAKALVRHWISRFGVPADVTADRGRQFTSSLWAELNRLLGIRATNTTAYHPQANGLVERLHRQLKAALMARSSGSWMDDLPLVLLGIRTSWRTELECSPSDLVYGMTVAVPGSFLEPVKREELPTTDFVRDLYRSMREFEPTQTSHHTVPKTHVPSSLATSEAVYIRDDAVRPPLVRPYNGPFKVLEKHDKYFVVDKKGKPDKVSIDRLKPALTGPKQKSCDVIPKAGSSNEDIQSEVAPGPKTRGRPRKTYSDAVKTKSVIRPPLPTQEEAFRTRSGRLSKRPLGRS